MADEPQRDSPNTADLMLAMVSGLPSDFLRRATMAAERRERREERLKVLHARSLQEAEDYCAEMEARAAAAAVQT